VRIKIKVSAVDSHYIVRLRRIGLLITNVEDSFAHDDEALDSLIFCAKNKLQRSK